jgi:hypothetical protein
MGLEMRKLRKNEVQKLGPKSKSIDMVLWDCDVWNLDWEKIAHRRSGKAPNPSNYIKGECKGWKPEWSHIGHHCSMNHS